MKRVFYRSPFIPREWIAAYGFKPVHFIPEGTKKSGSVADTEGVCPFMRSFVNEVIEAEAFPVVLTTVCDQMRRGFGVLRQFAGEKAFLFNLPSTWQGSSSKGLYYSELERLGSFLASMGGESPSKETLVTAMVEHEEKRESLFCDDIEGVPVALLGGAMSNKDRHILELVREQGGSVVIDGTETGERTRPARFNLDRMKADPSKELVEAYFGSIPDAFRRPNSALYEWLEEKVRERKPRGIIYFRQVWCDLWHAEVQRFRETFGIPLLDMDLNSQDSDVRNRTRVEAFMESLR